MNKAAGRHVHQPRQWKQPFPVSTFGRIPTQKETIQMNYQALSHLSRITNRGRSRILLPLLVTAATLSTTSANDIRGIRVVSESHNELKLSISYHYSGNFGSEVFMGVEMANDGSSSRHFSYRPARLHSGSSTATVILSTTNAAPQVFSTNQLKIKMYVGGRYSIVEELIPHQKNWRRFPLISIPIPHPTPLPDPAPSPAPLEDRLSFDNSCLRIVAEAGGRYLLTDGRSRMKVFPNRGEAEQALRIIRHYRFNSRGFVGRPGPSLEYWLKDDRAPVGSLPGEDAIRFNPRRLEVKHVQGSWKIVEGNCFLISFPNQAEATEALDVIRRYGFTHLCYVGRPNPSMTYLRR